MNLRRLAQQTGCPFWIQRPLRKRQPSQSNFCHPGTGHCITAAPSQPSGLMACKFSSPSQRLNFISMQGRTDRMGLGLGEEWHGFFLSEALQREWPGASDGGSLGWHKQALWWGYCGSSGVQAFRVCAEWGNSVSRSSLVFTSLFNFSQVMDFFWAMDTS